MADGGTTYFDIEIGLKTGGARELTLQEGRDAFTQDDVKVEAVVRPDANHQHKLTVASDNIAYVYTVRRHEPAQRRAEDASGQLISIGEVPRP